jgi:predicted nuclease of restriction endonuclease-like (RecB) superfamily
LLEQLKDFMLELGVGFAFVGSNYHLEIGGEDFYLDLLFYHLRLRSFVVVELKTTGFKPEYAMQGKKPRGSGVRPAKCA